MAVLTPTLVGTPGAAVASAANVATPTTLTPPVGSGYAVGDLLLCFTACASGTPTVATPSGWTPLINVVGSAAAVGRLALFGKLAASTSEAAPSVVWSGLTIGNTGTPCGARIQAVRNAQLVKDIETSISEVLPAGPSATFAAGGVGSAPTATSAVNDLLLALSLRTDDAGTWTAPSPPALALINSNGTTSGADFAFAWAYYVMPSTADIPAGGWTIAGGIAANSLGVKLALKAVVTPTTYNDTGTGTITASGSGGESYVVPVTYTDSRSGTATVSGTAVESYRPPPPPGYAGVVVADDPIVYWRFGEAQADNVAADTSNNGNVGTYTTWDTPAIKGLPGTLPSDPDTAVEFPVNPTTLAASTAFVVRYSFTPCPAGTSRTFEWWQFRTIEIQQQTVFAGGGSGPYLRFRGDIEFYPDYTRNAIGLPGPPLNVWTHIAITFDDATTRAEIFYNGVSQGAAVLGNGFSDPALQAEWTVGGRGPSGTFGGLIDEFALYPTVLSPARIQAHYDARLLVVAGPSTTYDDSGAGTITASGTKVESYSYDDSRTGTIVASGSGVESRVQTHFGVTASAYSFASATDGRRKTFGVIARPATFAATTSATRKTFGVVARPATFAATTAASRKTFGVVARTSSFGAVTDGRRKTFGIVALPTSFTATTSAIVTRRILGAVSLAASFAATTDGRRKTFGLVALPTSFTAATSASRKTFGVVARPSLFTATTSATRRAFGVVALPASFTATTAATRKTFGLVARPALFTAVTVGYRKTFGVVARPLSFAATTLGSRRTFGAVALPTSFSSTTVGRRQTFGVVVFPLAAPIDVRGSGFVGAKTYFGVVALPVTLLRATQGIRRTFSQVAMPLTFTEATQGRRRTFGQVALPLSFIETTQGRRSTFGRTALPLVLSEVTAGRRSTFSKTAMALVMTEVTQGRRVALGRILMPLTFDKATAGTRRAFGKTSLALLFDEASKGYRTSFGQIVLPITVEFSTDGFGAGKGTVLNQAGAVYLGDTLVVAIYTGTDQIWTP